MDKLPAKKIAIYLYDVRNRNVGLGEFSYQLGIHLAERAAELKRKYNISLSFIVPPHYVGSFGKDVSYIRFSSLFRWRVKYFTGMYDLCHITHQGSKLKKMHLAKKNLMTVHDINFMYEKHGVKLEMRKKKFEKGLKRVDMVSYISDFARKDVEKAFDTATLPYRVIYNGVKDLTGACGDISRFNLPENYLFHISSLQPKKNVHLLVEMMKYLPEENLVIVGNLNSDYAGSLMKRSDELGLKNIKFLNHVTNEEKAELYHRCRGFLFPSLCEGFGLPPIEVMHFGKPVFLSTLTSLPEVGGNVAYYYENLEGESMAETTRKGLTDFYSATEEKAMATKDRADSFSWKKCTDEYIKYYLEILGIKERQ